MAEDLIVQPIGEDEATGAADIRPHAASVLGGVLHSLGFDPGFDGPRIFGTRNTLARVFAGQMPTRTTMLRELRPAVDVAWDASAWNGGLMSLPFLHLARRLMGTGAINSADQAGKRPTVGARMLLIEKMPSRALSWVARRPELIDPVEMEKARVAACAPITAVMPGNYEVRDVPSLFAGLARLAGWSVADVAERFGITYADARGFMAQGEAAPPAFYEAAIAEIDAMEMRYGRPNVFPTATPADVALHWQRYGAEVAALSDDAPGRDPARFPPAGYFDPEGVVRPEPGPLRVRGE